MKLRTLGLANVAAIALSALGMGGATAAAIKPATDVISPSNRTEARRRRKLPGRSNRKTTWSGKVIPSEREKQRMEKRRAAAVRAASMNYTGWCGLSYSGSAHNGEDLALAS